MIYVKFNGKNKSVPVNTTLKDFLLEIKEEVVIPFAASINKEFIPQAHYESTILKDHDEVELVIPMQGG